MLDWLNLQNRRVIVTVKECNIGNSGKDLFMLQSNEATLTENITVINGDSKS